MKEWFALEADCVEPRMEIRERDGVPGRAPRSPVQVREHRWPVNTLEDERISLHLEHAWDGKPVRGGVLHDPRFALGLPAALEAPEHPSIAEVHNLRGTAGGDDVHPPELRLA
jgi:hypothetical protein